MLDVDAIIKLLLNNRLGIDLWLIINNMSIVDAMWYYMLNPMNGCLR